MVAQPDVPRPGIRWAAFACRCRDVGPTRGDMSMPRSAVPAPAEKRMAVAEQMKDRSGEPEIWTQPIDRLIDQLKSSPDGLTRQEAARRLATYGPNDATSRRRQPAWLRFAARFRNPLVLMLLVASAVSAAAGDLASFAIVAVVLTLSMTLDFVQEA